MPKILFDAVEKRYGAVRVLAPFNLELNDGEFTVLVGPSGCGKSTTLRMLAGLENLSGGEIFFNGRPVGRLAPKDRDIAMVFQDYALYPHMNIAQNMSFALRLKRRPRAEIDEKVRGVAGSLGIAHLLERKPGELSGGQRQRVAMGRALVRDASTFLFDEPLSNLDAKLRAKMRIELAELSQSIEKNMVYVTHDQVEAMTLGDRIVVMSDGVVQQQGTPQELFERPANLFVAGFIGSPSTNFLEAELLSEGGKLMLRGAGFSLAAPDRLTALPKHNTSPEVTIGIRPAALSLGGKADSEIDLQVVVAEYLGTNTIIATRCGEAQVLVDTPSGTSVRTGQHLRAGVNTANIMIFDRQSGNAL